MISISITNLSGGVTVKEFNGDGCKCDAQHYIRSIVKSDLYSKIEIVRLP